MKKLKLCGWVGVFVCVCVCVWVGGWVCVCVWVSRLVDVWVLSF